MEWNCCQYWVCHLCHQQREQTSFYSEAAFKIDTMRCACHFLPCLPFLRAQTAFARKWILSFFTKGAVTAVYRLTASFTASEEWWIKQWVGCDRFRQTIHIPPCPSPNLDKPYFSISIHHSSRDEVILNLPTTVMAIHSSLDIFWREALLQLMLPLVGQL